MLATVKEARTSGMKTESADQTEQRRMLAATRVGRSMKTLHRHISSQVMGAMQEQLQDEDLSFSQMSALHQLRAYAPLSVGGLAERTGLSLPAASHLTDRLVVRGYAQRRENPDDRRAKLLELTERGQQIVDTMDSRFTDAYRVTLQQVNPQAIEAAADAIEALLRELFALEAASAATRPGCPAPELAPELAPGPASEVGP